MFKMIIIIFVIEQFKRFVVLYSLKRQRTAYKLHNSCFVIWFSSHSYLHTKKPIIRLCNIMLVWKVDINKIINAAVIVLLITTTIVYNSLHLIIPFMTAPLIPLCNNNLENCYIVRLVLLVFIIFTFF
jgi:hypothetical protein